MECGKKFLYIKKKHQGAYHFAFVPARCKSWSCETCRPIKALRVRDYIREHFNSPTTYMLTLTFFHSGTAYDAWDNLGKCWNRMRTYIVKKHTQFNYLRVVEPHKNGGWPHMHILTDRFICYTDVVKKLTQWGFGWNMQNQLMDVQVASKYVSKYLTKEWPTGDAEILRRATKTRIVSVSRGMPPIFKKESEWECVTYDVPAHFSLWVCNRVIKKLQESGAIEIFCRPFGEGFYIISDREVLESWLTDESEPYTWKLCEDRLFAYAPYGAQGTLDL